MPRKPTKYFYYYILQGYYSASVGWEDLAAEDKAEGGTMAAWVRIRKTRLEYRQNEGGTYRIISRRDLRAPVEAVEGVQP